MRLDSATDNQMQPLVIAIDGPSGSGKSSLGKALARQLGIQYIDSGAVYRAVACNAIDSGISIDDAQAIARMATESEIRLEGGPDRLQVFVDGRDVSDRIRLADATNGASVVATFPEVREAVVEKLRGMTRANGVVMDGRDIGTKVFPDATVKFFLEASQAERAQRRWNEERERGRQVSLEDVESELEIRDRRDRERAATPLVKADDAILIDTSNEPLDSVVRAALELIDSRR